MKVTKLDLDKKYFRVNECVFPYCRHSYNFSAHNERAVEVPLGGFFIENFGYNVIEVGAVLCYYGYKHTEIIDISDPHERVTKANALDIDYTGKNVVSISTVEHLNTKEYWYGNKSDDDCISLLEKIVTQANNYLITWPIGFNLKLDKYVELKTTLPKFVLKRISVDNKWIKDKSMSFNYLYDSPFEWANAICCVTNLDVLL